MGEFYGSHFHDPHISAFRPPYESEDESFRGDPFEDRPQPAFPPGMERRLFSSLMAQERYSDIDKAKHNPHYLNYLLENYEDDLPY